jgi:hypothetical protein
MEAWLATKTQVKLKMKGKFMARDLWRDFEFQAHEDPFTPEEAEEFNRISDLLREIRLTHREFRTHNKVDHLKDPTSNLQFATKRILAHYRLRRAVKMAKESLARGEQPVIALEYINETDPDKGNVLAAIQTINTWKREPLKEDGKIVPGKSSFDEKIPEAAIAQAKLIEKAREVIPHLEDPVEYSRQWACSLLPLAGS